jgi:hypothetical protein
MTVSSLASSANLQEKTNVRSVVVFRTGDGRYLKSQMTYDAPVSTAEEATDVFEWTELGDERVAIRSAISGKYLGAHPRFGAGANREEIGLWETFTVVRSADDGFALQLSDSVHYLTIAPGIGSELSAGALTIGPSELFRTEQVAVPDMDDPAYAGVHGCCGPGHGHAETSSSEEPGALWEKYTHERIVEWGMHLLAGGTVRNPPTLEAAKMVHYWDNGPDFSGAVHKGLRDADTEWPWRGSNAVISYMFQNHFFDWNKGTNYMNQHSSALTEARRYFHLSAQVARRIEKFGAAAPADLYRQAGFYLGLSLHFLTDLTQPMHAANFTNVYGGDYPLITYPISASNVDRRHAGLEAYANQKVEGLLAGLTLEPGDLDIAGVDQVDSLLLKVAQIRKGIFINQVLPEAKKKVTERPGNPRTPSKLHYDNTWGAEADPALAASLRPAPREVARYLAYWASTLRQPLNIDSKRWYRIVAPGSRHVSLKNGHHGCWNESGDHSLFYFLFNTDGTCTIACKGWKANPWFIYRALNGGYYVGEYKNASHTPDLWSRFRVVPGPGGKVWIYEPSFDEVVTVAEDRYLVREHPCFDDRQLFTLEPADAISDADRTEIRKIWPNFGDLPWWGAV